ncbi:MAG: hypothetical protein KHX20_09435 [Megasphaera sp.]|jgi:hypothetical protein|nr:hypothetical protein [Megasphaera sp.]
MKTFSVTIEERVCEEFMIPAETPEKAEELARKLYKDGKIVLEPGNLLDASFTVME